MHINIGEDGSDHSANELINHTPFCKGWLSSRFCNYPQELLIEFRRAVSVSKIQFLSHQYAIATSIEMYALAPGATSFTKIGHISLDSNKRSNYQARELKTVHANFNAVQCKFRFMSCYTNVHNIYTQVGLIALNILGKYHAQGFQGNVAVANAFANLEDEMIYDPVTLKRLKELYVAKDKAIEMEDLDEANNITRAICSLKAVSQSLVQLEERKKVAIRNEDYDSAKVLKYEIDRLRNAVIGVDLDEIDKHLQMVREEKERKRLIAQNPQMQTQMQGISNNNSITNSRKQTPSQQQQQFYQQQQQQVQKMPTPKQQQQQQLIQQQQQQQSKPAVINVDNMHVGITKSFEELVEDALNSPENYRDTAPLSALIPEKQQLSKDAFLYAEPFIPTLGLPLIKLLFSSQWKAQEIGLKQLSQNIKAFPHSTLFQNKTPEDIITATLGISATLLSSPTSLCLISTMEIIKLLLTTFPSFDSYGPMRNAFEKHINTIVSILLEHLGNVNVKVKESAESTLIAIGTHRLIGSKLLFEQVMSGPIRKTQVSSNKHIRARYLFCNKLINIFGYNNVDIPLQNIMDYAVKGYSHSQKNVRDAALKLILTLYKYEGNNIQTYYQNLRQAQINTIEDAIYKMNSGKDDANDNDDDDNDYNEQQQHFDTTKQHVVSSGGSGNKGMNVPLSESQMLDNEKQLTYQQQMNEMNNIDDDGKDYEHTCNFCGLFDPYLTLDLIEIHQFKECPMLTQCIKCGQIQQISEYNNHLLNECPNKNDFIQCDRCKEPIMKSEYNIHKADAQCVPFKPLSLASRCPLCHQDITPPGQNGWSIHLLQQTCPNNPRSKIY